MAKRVYTAEDRAAFRLAYEANNGVLRAAVRSAGIPLATGRDWVKKWEKEGLPAEVQAALPEVKEKFVADAMRIRDKALTKFEEAVDAGKVSSKDLLLSVGILTDKVRLVQGQSTSNSQSESSMPVEQVRELFAGFAKGIVEAAEQRGRVISQSFDGEVIDAEATAIPAGELLPAER